MDELETIESLNAFELGFLFEKSKFIIKKSKEEKERLENNLKEAKSKMIQIFYQLYDRVYTPLISDILFIENNLFKEKMEEYSKKLIECIENNEPGSKKRKKVTEEGEEEQERKRIRIKDRFEFTMSELNKIFY